MSFTATVHQDSAEIIDNVVILAGKDKGLILQSVSLIKKKAFIRVDFSKNICI